LIKAGLAGIEFENGDENNMEEQKILLVR